MITINRQATTTRSGSRVPDNAFLAAMGVNPAESRTAQVVHNAPVMVDEEAFKELPVQPAESHAEDDQQQQQPQPSKNNSPNTDTWKDTAKKYWWVPALLIVIAGGWYAWKKGYLKLS